MSRVKAFGSLLLNFLRKPVTVKEGFGFLADTFRWLPRRDDNKCTGCGACSERCSTGATTVNDAGMERKVSIDSWMCIFCGRCAEICPEKALVLTFEQKNEEEIKAREALLSKAGEKFDVGVHCSSSLGRDTDAADKYVQKISLAHTFDEPRKTVDTTIKLQRCSVCGEVMPVTEKYLNVIHERTLKNLQPEIAAIIEKDMKKYLTACISCRRKNSLEWDTHPRKFI
jgi:formate hydrogenlyase subunit 6/NADH:ubiquinone oxidoreductase subunit I